ncbi:MAG: tetratricopeptide repeat protein [Chitinivibrionales bacterium]
MPLDKQQLEELRDAWRQNPDDRDSGVRLAQYYADLGWYNEAIELYRELMNRFGQDYAIILEYGNICFNRQDIENAYEAFERLTTLRPRKLEGWNNLGIVHLTRKDFDAARRCFEKVLELEPDNYGALLNLGNYYDQKEENQRAIELFEKAAEARPDFADAWFNLGNAYVKAQRLRDAIPAYQKAIRYQPEFPSALKNLGVVYERLDQVDAALKLYTEALELNKADAGIYMNIASIHTRRKEYDKAKDFFLRSVRLSPKSPAGWMGLRELSLLKGDIETYTKSTLAIIHRLDADTIADTVRKLRRLQQFARIDEIIKLSDKLDKRSDELDAERILAYQRKDEQKGKAAALFKRLSGTEAMTDTIRAVLAEYSLQNKQFDEAVTQVNKLHHKDSISLRLQWQALISQGKTDKAERQIRKYLLSHQGCPDCWYFLAVIAALDNNADQARGHLTRALENGFAETELLQQLPLLWELYEELTTV